MIIMSEHEGPRRGDRVRIELDGHVVGPGPGAPQGHVLVMIHHPRDGSQLTEVYVPADAVTITQRA